MHLETPNKKNSPTPYINRHPCIILPSHSYLGWVRTGELIRSHFRHIRGGSASVEQIGAHRPSVTACLLPGVDPSAFSSLLAVRPRFEHSGIKTPKIAIAPTTRPRNLGRSRNISPPLVRPSNILHSQIYLILPLGARRPER